MRILRQTLALTLICIVSDDTLIQPTSAEWIDPLVAKPVTCPKEPGLLAGPFVFTSKTAYSIFDAVARGLRGDEFMKAYEIKVKEESSEWVLYQSLKPEPDSCSESNPQGTKCTITAGGGGLAMHINKCTGAISHAHYLR